MLGSRKGDQCLVSEVLSRYGMSSPIVFYVDALRLSMSLQRVKTSVKINSYRSVSFLTGS